MAAAHTPGPWTIADELTVVNGIGVIAGDYGIAKVWDVEIGNQAENRANAHLIAAAPDIFETGKVLADRDVRFVEGDIVIPCGSHGEALKAFRLFRAALAKAEGRA